VTPVMLSVTAVEFTTITTTPFGVLVGVIDVS
jgi:hypothetical protein